MQDLGHRKPKLHIRNEQNDSGRVEKITYLIFSPQSVRNRRFRIPPRRKPNDNLLKNLTTMKKFLLSLVLGISALCASAVEPFIEFQPIQAGDYWTAFNFQGGFTAKVHPNIALGAGFGITERWNFDSAPLIPLFARLQFEGRIRSLYPFFSFDVGYEINTEHTDCGAVLVNPMVGLKFNRCYFGIGYLGHCWTPKHADSTSCFNMKIGYNF